MSHGFAPSDSKDSKSQVKKKFALPQRKWQVKSFNDPFYCISENGRRLAFLTDGRLMHGANRELRIYDPLTGGSSGPVELENGVISVLAVFPSGRVFIGCGWGYSWFLDVENINFTPITSSMPTVVMAVFVLSNQLLAIAEDRWKYKLLLFDSSKIPYSRSEINASCMAYLEGERYFITGHCEYEPLELCEKVEALRLHDVENNCCFVFLDGEACGAIIHLSLLDGRTDILSVHDHGLQLWDIKERILKRALAFKEKICLFSVFPGNKYFVMVLSDDPSKIELRETKTLKIMDSYKAESPLKEVITHVNGQVGYLTYSDIIGTYYFPILFQELESEIARLFPEVIEELIHSYLLNDVRLNGLESSPAKDILGMGNKFNLTCKVVCEKFVVLSEDLIAVADDKGVIQLLDGNLKEKERFPSGSNHVSALSSLSHERLAIGTLEGQVYIVDITNISAPQFISTFHENFPIRFIVEELEGGRIVVGSSMQSTVSEFHRYDTAKCRAGISVWDKSGKKREYHYDEEYEISALTVSPVGKILYAIWDKQRSEIKGVGSVSDVPQSTNFSIDNHWYIEKLIFISDQAFICPDGCKKVKVFDVISGSVTRGIVIDGHMKILTAITPDGRHFYSSHADGSIRLWDLEGRCIDVQYIKHENKDAHIYHLDVMPDGRVVYSTSYFMGITDFPHMKNLRAPFKALEAALPTTIADVMRGPLDLGILVSSYVGSDYCFWQPPEQKAPASKASAVTIASKSAQLPTLTHFG